MILCDRKRLKNPNGLILGTPGSGKSFSAKREITNAFLITADDIIICDPEAEYYPLVERLKGCLLYTSRKRERAGSRGIPYGVRAQLYTTQRLVHCVLRRLLTGGL